MSGASVGAATLTAMRTCVLRWGVSSAEGLAVASITGIAEAYASVHRLDWQQAMQEIQDCLAHYRIPAERIQEVLSEAARQYLSGDRHFHADALRLLLNAGADLDRAQVLGHEAGQRRSIRIGDATLGG